MSPARVREPACIVTGGASGGRYPVSHYRSSCDGDVVTIRRGSEAPGKATEVERVQILVPLARIRDPVLVDLLSGEVYSIDQALWTETWGEVAFRNVPVYDSVTVIADRCAVPLAR